MRDLLEAFGPSRNVARRMHELEAELRQARTQLRRHNKSPETLGRWGLDTPAPAQQEEGWFITYLDMMTLLLVVMIVMLAFSGSIGGLKRNDAQAAGSSAQVAAAQVDGASAASAQTARAPQFVETVEKSESVAPSEPSEPAQGVAPAVDAALSAESSAPSEAARSTRGVAPSAEAAESAGSSAPPTDAAESTRSNTSSDPTGDSAQNIAVASPASSSGAGHSAPVKIAGGAGLLPGGLGFLPGKGALGDTQTIPGHAAATVAADMGPLPPDATVLPSIQAAVSLAELYPGWAAEETPASFVGPPHPEEMTGAPLPSSPGTMAAAEPAEDVPTEGESLAAGMALAQLGNDVEVVVNERSVSFRVNSEILFDSSQADLSRPGLSVLRKIIAVLADTDHNVTVEGHTDAVPVRRNVRYPSNWELSSSRAGSVVRYLQANGIDKTRLKAIGYADARPIDDNNTPEGRARNRRVELIIEKHD